MRDLFRGRADTSVELLKSGGGVFEITIDGELAYSKKRTGRFPDDSELQALISG